MGMKTLPRHENVSSGPFATLVQAIRRHPWRTLGVYAVMLAGAIAAATTLGIDTDSSKMLNPELKFQEQALKLREAFPRQKETVVIAVRAGTPDKADEVVDRLVNSLAGQEGIAEVFAPASDPFLLGHGLLYLSTDEVDDQLSRIGSSANLIAGLRADQSLDGFVDVLNQARTLADGAGEGEDLGPIYEETAAVVRSIMDGTDQPFGWTGAFTGTSGQTLRLINIQPELNYAVLNPAKQALAAVRAAIAEMGPVASVAIGITGEPALRQEELRSVAAKIGLSLGLSFIFVAGVLWLALRTTGRMALGLGALMMTLTLTTGFAAIAVGSLNLISVAFIVLMVGLGIDFAIHFLAHLDEKSGLGDKALIGTAHSIGPALALTAASTSLAFFAFTVTDFVGMAQLGLIGGAGVLIAFVVSLTFIPAVVALRPSLAAGKARGQVPGGVSDGPWFAIVMLVVGVGSIWLASQARFDADPMSLRDPNAQSVQAFNWLAADEKRSPLRVSVLTGSPEEAADMADRLKLIDGVKSAGWLGSLVPEDQDEKLELVDLAWPSLEHAVEGEPENIADAVPISLNGLAEALTTDSTGADLSEALAAYQAVRSEASDARLEAMLFQNFPLLTRRLAAMLEIDEITVDALPTPMTAQYLSDDGLYLVEARPVADIRDPAARAKFVDLILAEVPDATGAPAQIEGARRAVAAAMIQAVAIALAGAGLLSMLFLRSVTGTLAILVPVTLASAVCMAAGVLLDLPFNYANVIVLPLMIGIGVDSGVHLAIRARQTGEVFETSTPMATFYSALTTIAAFGTLGLSDHRGTASMGILLAIGLIATVLMTFALTPRLAQIGHTKT